MADQATDLSQEIDELIGSLSPEPSPEPTPTPPVETPPKEEIPPKEEPTPLVDDKGTGEPTPKPDGEPVTTPTPPDPGTLQPPALEGGEETAEELRERIKLLLGHIESLTPVPGVAPTPEPKPAEVKGEPSPTPAPTPSPASVKVEEVDFLSGTTPDDVIDDPKKFNDLLNTVYQKARSDAKEDAARAILSALPGLVSNEVVATSNTNAIVADFYAHNEDLVAVKRTVMAVAAQVHAEKPELGHKEVLTEAANRTRTLLGIKKPMTKSNDKFSDPGFVDKGGTRTPTTKGPTTLQQEIDDFIAP